MVKFWASKLEVGEGPSPKRSHGSAPGKCARLKLKLNISYAMSSENKINKYVTIFYSI